MKKVDTVYPEDIRRERSRRESYRSGLIGVLILLALLGAIVFALAYIYQNYSKSPNAATKKAVKSIIKYPTSTSWVESEYKNVCLLTAGGCSQPIRILFETPNDWGSVYSYYVPTMTQSNWTTNSAVVTSIPSSVVFMRASDNCEATLANHNELKFSFTVVCPDPK